MTHADLANRIVEAINSESNVGAVHARPCFYGKPWMWDMVIEALRAFPSAERRIDLSRYINAADISAADVPHVVVEKLQKAINAAPQEMQGLAKAGSNAPAVAAPLAPPTTAAPSWNYGSPPHDEKDCRRLVTLEQGGMQWVGIRAWHHERQLWMNGGEPEAAVVVAWMWLPEPAWLQGSAEPANALTSPTAAPSGYKLVRADVLAWLHGEAPHPETGEWFERPSGEGAYWWRSRLRKATVAPSTAAGSEEIERLAKTVERVAWEQKSYRETTIADLKAAAAALRSLSSATGGKP